VALIHVALVKQTKAFNAASLVWIFMYTSDHFKGTLKHLSGKKGACWSILEIRGSSWETHLAGRTEPWLFIVLVLILSS